MRFPTKSTKNYRALKWSCSPWSSAFLQSSCMGLRKKTSNIYSAYFILWFNVPIPNAFQSCGCSIPLLSISCSYHTYLPNVQATTQTIPTIFFKFQFTTQAGHLHHPCCHNITIVSKLLNTLGSHCGMNITSSQLSLLGNI